MEGKTMTRRDELALKAPPPPNYFKLNYIEHSRIPWDEMDGLSSQDAAYDRQARAEALRIAKWSYLFADSMIKMSEVASVSKDIGNIPLAVWYGSMPESNGKANWTATLYRKEADAMLDGFCFARSEYPDRVRYEADRMRWIVGELRERPHILDYDADLHSGYTSPLPAQAPQAREITVQEAAEVPEVKALIDAASAMVLHDGWGTVQYTDNRMWGDAEAVQSALRAIAAMKKGG